MKTVTTLSALTLSALMGLGACTTANTGADTEEAEWINDPRLGEKVDRVCFKSNIDSFRQPTRNTVIVEEGVNDEYLLVTMGSCHDLDWANSLSFDTRPVSSSCLSRGDSIYAYDSAFGPDRTDIPAQRCPISAIYEWNEDALEEEADMDGEE